MKIYKDISKGWQWECFMYQNKKHHIYNLKGKKQKIMVWVGEVYGVLFAEEVQA